MAGKGTALARTGRCARQRRQASPKGVSLKSFKPDAKPFSHRQQGWLTRRLVASLAEELDALQNLFYADGRYKLLVVLQGTDTSGKDGTVRGVFARTSPLGVHTVGWKAPTEAERDHDYLWRIHQQGPGRGRDHDLQPQPLRRRAGTGGQRLDHARSRRCSATSTSRTSSACWPRPAR